MSDSDLDINKILELAELKENNPEKYNKLMRNMKDIAKDMFVMAYEATQEAEQSIMD